MSPASRSSRLAERQLAVPSEIYIPLVDSLYKDGRTLLIGTLRVVGSILTTFWKTGEPLFLACAAAVVAVACTRGLVMRAYARARMTVTSNPVARRWERRYVTGAAASVGLLGIWCYIAFATTNDEFAHLVSFSITIAYVVGIFGRPYPLLAKPISLMTVDASMVAGQVYNRYPFFRSTFFERRMLFERKQRMAAAFMSRQATVLPIDSYRPAQQV